MTRHSHSRSVLVLLQPAFLCACVIPLLWTGAGGCFSPDYGETAFSCANGAACPGGYTCQRLADAGMVCVKAGPAADQGTPGRDRGPDRAPGREDGKVPRPDKAVPQIDKSTVQLDKTTTQIDKSTTHPDKTVLPLDASKPPPDKAPPIPDLPSMKPDQAPPTGPPIVKLTYPVNGISIHDTNVTFKFTVTGGKPTVSCSILLQSSATSFPTRTLTTTQISNGSYTWDYPPDGTYTWTLTCLGSDMKSSMMSQKFSVGPDLKTTVQCGTTLAHNTRYKLTKELSLPTGSGTCLEIKASSVTLDGANIPVVSNARADLVVTSSKSYDFTIYRNSSKKDSLSFSQKSGLSGTSTAATVPFATAGDVDDDGDMDLFLPYNSGLTELWVNTGGAFVRSTQFSIPSSYNLRALRLVDLDQDGVLDLFGGTSAQNSQELVWRGTKGGVPGSHKLVGVLGDKTENVDLLDANGDGLLDVVTASAYDTTLNDRRHVALNNSTSGNVYFKPGAWQTNQNDARGSGPTFVTDFDNDGHWDLVVAHYGTQPLLKDARANLLLGKGDGTFSRATGWPRADRVPQGVADLDGDGYPDVVLATVAYVSGTYELSGVQILYGGKSGVIGASASPGAMPSGGIAGALLANLSSDLRPDLVVIPAKTNAGLVVLQNPVSRSGTWSPIVITTPPVGQVTGLGVRDLDGDGDQDLVVAVHDAKANPAGKLVPLANTGSKFVPSSSVVTSSQAPLYLNVPGNLDSGPLTGVHIMSVGARLRNLGPVRGFDRGVVVYGAWKVVLDTVVVQDPQQVGIWVYNGAQVEASNVEVRQLHRGTGMVVDGSKTSVTLSGATLCPEPTHDPTLTPLSLACVGSSSVTISGSKASTLKLHSGCGLASNAWDRCP